MTNERTKDIMEIFAEGTAVDRALQEGVRQALRRHKLLGQSVAVWRDGQVVIVPPEEIPVEPGEDGQTFDSPPPRRSGL